MNCLPPTVQGWDPVTSPEPAGIVAAHEATPEAGEKEALC